MTQRSVAARLATFCRATSSSCLAPNPCLSNGSNLVRESARQVLRQDDSCRSHCCQSREYAIWDEYVRCFNEKTIRGSCGDYRAAATIDCELDTADLGRRLAMPILVLWGQNSSVGRRFADPLALWRDRAKDVRGEALPTGHYVNEE